MKSIIYAVLLLTSLTHGSPANHHVVHEKRRSNALAWENIGRVPQNYVLDMRIALKEQNIHLGPHWLDEVSNPTSDKYGKHWSAEEVAEAFRPSDETISAVLDWLGTAGINDYRLTRGQNWVQLNISIAQAENLLKTEYSMHQHRDGALQIACDEYSLPLSVKKHIDFVLPTVHFTRPTNGKSLYHGDVQHEKRAPQNVPSVSPNSDQPGRNIYNLPKLLNGAAIKGILDELSRCANFTTPNCLRALYGVPPNIVANPKNSFGIVEYTPQTYITSDLDVFFRNFSPRAVGSRPIFNSIDGGVLQQDELGFNYVGESSLDLQYAMALTYPINVTLFQVGDLIEGASFNNFLDAIDALYCTYMGGDDPTQDAIYPNPAPGGYKGPQNCGGYAPSKVISTSYGYNEADLTPFYEQRQCNEYMKLGLAGTTIVYSSGDYGVAGNGGQCLNQQTKQLNGMTKGAFAPGFPSVCPYVLAVGATEVIPGTDVVKARLKGQQPERACQTIIYSGGGFSNVFGVPAYQKAAVTNFFQKYPPAYTDAQYNNSMQTRGYPDISANGASYLIAVQGKFIQAYGTSASAPTVGSLVTLINNARLYVGKGPVGFINPTLYAHPEVLYDITQGGNPGCGTAGFSATPGWDPVTGLGTPNFPKMLALFLSLP